MLKHVHIVQPGRMSVVYLGEYQDKPDESLLEDIFAHWNAGSRQECDVFLRSRTRSLSVGDFVGLNGKFYHCKSVGWVGVPRTMVNLWCEHVEARMVEAGQDSWTALNDLMWQIGR